MSGFFDTDFDPTRANQNGLKPDQRLAIASEYSAHHVGKISRNLERLIAILEKNQKADGGTF